MVFVVWVLWEMGLVIVVVVVDGMRALGLRLLLWLGEVGCWDSRIIGDWVFQTVFGCFLSEVRFVADDYVGSYKSILDSFPDKTTKRAHRKQTMFS